ncbi:MAG: EamA family transporter [Bacteroidales bacterium]|nr:EamA family transporter [Bacteroidales bacterium]
MEHLYILGTIIFTVYGQLILKWRIGQLGIGLQTIYFKEKLLFLAQLLLDPFVLSGLLSAFIAALFWMMAMTKFELSYAYPFMGLTYAIVFGAAVFFFGETFTLNKLVGILLIVIGIVVLSRTNGN